MSAIYVKVDGVDGEATDDQHRDWINVLGYSHSVSQPHATASTGGGARGGISKCEHGAFVMEKQLDKASPKLALLCCNGKRIPTIEVHVARQVDDKMTYLKCVMTGCLVRNHHISGNGDAGERPSEDVSFAYEKIEWTYTEVDPRTNKPNGDTVANWDCLQNVGG